MKAQNQKLRIDGVDETNINNHYRVTTSGSGSLNKHTIKNRSDIVNVFINIDNHLIEVYTYKHFEKEAGKLYYFYFFGLDNDLKYNIYVPVNYILNGEIFYTDRKEGRRNYKLKKIIEKITS